MHRADATKVFDDGTLGGVGPSTKFVRRLRVLLPHFALYEISVTRDCHRSLGFIAVKGFEVLVIGLVNFEHSD